MERDRRNQRTSSHEDDFRSRDQGRWGRENDRNRNRENQGDFNESDFNRSNQGSSNRGYNEGQNRGNDWGSSGNMYNQDQGYPGRWQEDYGRSRQHEGYNRENENRGYNQGSSWENDYGSQGSGQRSGYSDWGGSQGRSGNQDFGQQRFGSSSDWGGSQSGFGNQDRNWSERNPNPGYGSLGSSRSYGEENWMRGENQGRRMGEHKGKGPKGYQRSADRIREEISDRLSDDDELDASNIEVNVQGNEVTLTGTVDSKSDKRRAEDIAESISGVTNVSNQLRIGKQSEAPMPDLPSGQASGQTKTSSSTGQLKHDKAHHN